MRIAAHRPPTGLPTLFELAYTSPDSGRKRARNALTFVSADTALCYSKPMIERPNPDPHPWIIAARERGWGDVMESALEMVEPVAPVLAQLLWVALETPEGVAALREQLQDEEPDSDRG